MAATQTKVASILIEGWREQLAAGRIHKIAENIYLVLFSRQVVATSVIASGSTRLIYLNREPDEERAAEREEVCAIEFARSDLDNLSNSVQQFSGDTKSSNSNQIDTNDSKKQGQRLNANWLNRTF